MYRILEALATKQKIPKSLDGRLMLRSFSRKFQPKTDLGLRVEVVQSFRLDGLKKRSLTIYPSLRSNLALFIFAPFLNQIQTVQYPGALKKVAYMPRSGGKYPRECAAQYWLLSVFL